MIIGIDPVLLAIGGLAVRWSGVLALLGLGLAVGRSVRELDRRRLRPRLALDALAWALPAGLLVARLVNVLGWWDYYLTHLRQIWQLNLDGMSLWGGLLGGGSVFLARVASGRDPLRGRRMLDIIAPNLAMGIGVGRVGAFLDGHGQGLPSDLPWATQYTSPLAATPDFGVPRHPAQVYDALIACGVYLVLRSLPRRLPAGSRAAAFLVLYGMARLVLGPVRLDPAFLFGLQIEQLLALGAVLFGLAYGLRPLLAARRAVLGPPPGRQTHHPPAREDSLAA